MATVELQFVELALEGIRGSPKAVKEVCPSPEEGSKRVKWVVLGDFQTISY